MTYPFSIIRSAILLSNIAPKLFGSDLHTVCREYEAAHGGTPLGTTAYRVFSARAVRLTNPELVGKMVAEVEKLFNHDIFVHRMREAEGGPIVDCTVRTVLKENAILAVSGGLGELVNDADQFGPELKDVPLLDFSTELRDLVVASKASRLVMALLTIAGGNFM